MALTLTEQTPSAFIRGRMRAESRGRQIGGADQCGSGWFGIRNFLVLTVTPSAERAANICAISREIDAQGRGLRMFLFGSERAYSLEEPSSMFAPIWHSASDEAQHSLLE